MYQDKIVIAIIIIITMRIVMTVITISIIAVCETIYVNDDSHKIF